MTKQSGTLIGQAGLAGLLALMLGQSAQGVAFSAFTPALPQMAQSFNASGHGMVLAQQAVTIAAFGLIAGSFASGKIIDMFGARMTILVSMLLFAVCGSGGLFLQNVWILLATRVVVGFAIACTTTACINTISTVFQGNLRSQAIGMSSGFGSALGLISLLLGGFLAQNFGWREAFIQFPVFGFLALILALLGVKNTHAEVAHETDLNTHAGLREAVAVLRALHNHCRCRVHGLQPACLSVTDRRRHQGNQHFRCHGDDHGDGDDRQFLFRQY